MNDLISRLGLLRSALIYLWKPYTRCRMCRFYSQFVQPGTLCFDIGAHVGSRTRVFLDLGARVVALEPQPQCFDYLAKRWRGEHRCKLIQQGVASQSGTAVLYINRSNPTISTLASGAWRRAMAAAAMMPERWDRKMEVEVTTLDRLMEDYGMPHFCKIDVEGFEDQALAGLSRPIQALSFEFISFEKERMSACIRRLTRLGTYRFNWSLRERMKLESPVWMEAPHLERVIRSLGPGIVSGDIYARLIC
jgi:FkbM family methyltransferase